MKDKELRIRMDSDFEEKVDYLQKINDYKNRSDTIRRTVEKEYRKETIDTECDKMFPNCQDCSRNEKCEEKAYEGLFGKGRREQTNFEKIQKMSIDELADKITDFVEGCHCPAQKLCFEQGSERCEDTIKRWLLLREGRKK